MAPASKGEDWKHGDAGPFWQVPALQPVPVRLRLALALLTYLLAVLLVAVPMSHFWHAPHLGLHLPESFLPRSRRDAEAGERIHDEAPSVRRRGGHGAEGLVRVSKRSRHESLLPGGMNRTERRARPETCRYRRLARSVVYGEGGRRESVVDSSVIGVIISPTPKAGGQQLGPWCAVSMRRTLNGE